MSPVKIAIGFVPWLVFSLVCGFVGPHAVPEAAFAGLTLALLLVVRSKDKGQSVKLVEAAAVPTFAAIGIWALLVPATDGFLAGYGRGLATLVLAAVLWASLMVRPFTEQYARDSVPQQYWDSPRFHAVNRRISAAWAVAVTTMGVGHLVSGALEGQPAALARPADLLLNWVVPGAITVLAVRYTLSTARAAHSTSPVTGARLPS